MLKTEDFFSGKLERKLVFEAQFKSVLFARGWVKRGKILCERFRRRNTGVWSCSEKSWLIFELRVSFEWRVFWTMSCWMMLSSLYWLRIDGFTVFLLLSTEESLLPIVYKLFQTGFLPLLLSDFLWICK